MSAITHALTRKPEIKGPADSRKEIAGTIFTSETGWFVVALILFLVLGPFAAIAAIPAICSVIPKEGEVREPEAVRDR